MRTPKYLFNDRLTLSSKGFTLIEVLISVIVFSIGLIGLASLQTIALRNNNESYMRSQATLLTQDIADRMRANLAGVSDGSYDMGNDVDAANSKPAFDCVDTFPGPDNTCSAQEIAQVDLHYWTNDKTKDDTSTIFAASIAEALPGGKGIVCLDSVHETDPTPGDPKCNGLGNVYAIKIWWDQDRDGDPENDPVMITSFRP